MNKLIAWMFDRGYKESGLAADLHYLQNVIDNQLDFRIKQKVETEVMGKLHEFKKLQDDNELLLEKIRKETEKIIEKVVKSISQRNVEKINR